LDIQQQHMKTVKQLYARDMTKTTKLTMRMVTIYIQSIHARRVTNFLRLPVVELQVRSVQTDRWSAVHNVISCRVDCSINSNSIGLTNRRT